MRVGITYDRAGNRTYHLDGRVVTEAEFNARLGVDPAAFDPNVLPGGTPTTGWPLESQALAVHAKQVDAANARAKRHGINVHYKKDGTCVIPDRANRKKLLRLEGYHDNNAGYSD